MKPSNLGVASLSLTLSTASLLVADQVSGTATLNAETATFTLGVGTWKPADHQVSLGLFAGPASGATDRPYLKVDLTFKEDATTASADTLKYCHISFSSFKGSPFDLNGFAKDCGVTALSGDLKPGGTVTAALKGSTEFKMPSSRTKTMNWDFKTTSSLRPADFAVDVAVAVGPKAVTLPAGGGEPGSAFLKEKCRSGVSGPAAALAMQNCKILAGAVDAAMAVLAVEADTMGSRMRNDFVLAKEASGWTVKKEGAWRSVH